MKSNPSQYGHGTRGKPGPDLVGRMSVEALAFLAADSARLDRFLDITGLNAQTLRQTAASPGFDLSLLDYLGSDERLLRAFAAAHGYDPAEVDAARISLSPSHHGDDT